MAADKLAYPVEPRIEVERWYVVTNLKGEWRSGWFGWWGHCLAFTEAGPGVVLILDPVFRRYLTPITTLVPTHRLVSHFLYTGNVVQTLTIAPGHGERSPWALPVMLTCASVVAYGLGLKRLPLTPSGLRRYLAQLGAEEVGHGQGGRGIAGRGARRDDAEIGQA